MTRALRPAGKGINTQTIAVFQAFELFYLPAQVFFGEPGKYCYSLTISHID